MPRDLVDASLPKDRNSSAIQVLPDSGTRVNLTAGVATSNAALPSGADDMVIVRCTDYFWLNFGTSGVTASAAATSILCPPGEGAYVLPSGATHFAGLRYGASDVIVQVAAVN